MLDPADVLLLQSLVCLVACEDRMLNAAALTRTGCVRALQAFWEGGGS